MSPTYKDSGVDIKTGDRCSEIAYGVAKKTFQAREGKFAFPVNVEMGFSSLLDMGAFYLTFNCDGIGSKVKVAQAMGLHNTLGFDLVAMVADDCICLGAEPVAMVNTLDMEKVDPLVVEQLMGGLEKAATQAGVAVVGGEIAELRELVRGYHWSASIVGIVKKERLIAGREITAGDTLVALLTDNFRSNGFTLVRKVLEGALGPWWHRVKYDETTTWGEKILSPSTIYTPLVLHLIGRFDGAPKAKIHGIAHITGGGLRHNLQRILPPGLDIRVATLPTPPEVIARVRELGKISKQEAYQVWNMGIGMVLVTPEPERVLSVAQEQGIKAQIFGEVCRQE